MDGNNAITITHLILKRLTRLHQIPGGGGGDNHAESKDSDPEKIGEFY